MARPWTEEEDECFRFSDMPLERMPKRIPVGTPLRFCGSKVTTRELHIRGYGHECWYYDPTATTEEERYAVAGFAVDWPSIEVV